MDLREKIAEVLYQRPEYPSGMAEKLARDAAQRRADAVMGVVEEDAVKRRAYTERRVELARKAEAAKWETRVRALEDENQRMREIIADQIFAAEQECQAAIVKNPTSASLNGHLVGLQRARDIALSRAREIAEEEA